MNRLCCGHLEVQIAMLLFILETLHIMTQTHIHCGRLVGRCMSQDMCRTNAVLIDLDEQREQVHCSKLAITLLSYQPFCIFFTESLAHAWIFFLSPNKDVKQKIVLDNVLIQRAWSMLIFWDYQDVS